MVETATLTLADFVLARIAEREEEARRGVDELDPEMAELKVTIWDLDTGIRYRPRYELARCAADRQIVELATTEVLYQKHGLWDDHARDAAWVVVQILALPHADHPDYRPEWAV